jgi:hypothetical protein
MLSDGARPVTHARRQGAPPTPLQREMDKMLADAQASVARVRAINATRRRS